MTAKLFNEKKLKTEIEKVWGKFGVHADLFNRIITDRDSAKTELKELKTMLNNPDQLAEYLSGI